MTTPISFQTDDLLGSATYAYSLARFTDPGIHWYYLPVTAGYMDHDNIDAYRGGFSHNIYNVEQGAISNLYEPALHVLLTALDKQGQQLENLYRIRLGFATRTPTPVVHSPHIDRSHPHRTGLFYIHDTDGPTVIYNEKCVYNDPVVPVDYTVADRVEPRANRWADFDGAHFHSSTSPVKNEERFVLTFNYSVVGGSLHSEFYRD